MELEVVKIIFLRAIETPTVDKYVSHDDSVTAIFDERNRELFKSIDERNKDQDFIDFIIDDIKVCLHTPEE